LVRRALKSSAIASADAFAAATAYALATAPASAYAFNRFLERP
jgi:hypothetical protein